MQVLQLKRRDEQGQEAVVGVKVLRSWQDGSGRQVYLHANGIYGYKDGSPVRTQAELDVIGSKIQREMARRWWDATGKKLSAEFYKKKEDAERARHDDFIESSSESSTERDQVLYRVRPKGGRKADWSEPFAWMERFNVRPDWWGQAEGIVLKGFEYEKVDAAVAETSGNIKENEV